MLRRTALVLAPCAIGALILSTDRQVVLLHLTTAAERAEQLGNAGIAGYVLCFVVATLMMIPTGPLEMAAGLLFTRRLGLLGAITLAAVAKQVSGSVGFLLGRTLFRESAQETVVARFPIFKAVMQAVKTEPFTVTCSLALTPSMVRFAPIPTTAKSMGLAASGVSFGPFLLASSLFGAPWSALSAVVGSTLASLPEILEGRGEEKMREILKSWKEEPLLLTCGALLSILAVAFLMVKTRKLLKTYRDLMQKAA
ncbi:unnamed protein product [Cladocopium goreaui]|uniref:TVP38/TMEM64 family membrane protein YdjX n=1 Tax=Cladocopium goreaui TaxID=2562237 RepID=A0A9P1GC51_9DINO|nr:unnamed protein product [Cladocopium goreaui]